MARKVSLQPFGASQIKIGVVRLTAFFQRAQSAVPMSAMFEHDGKGPSDVTGPGKFVFFGANNMDWGPAGRSAPSFRARLKPAREKRALPHRSSPLFVLNRTSRFKLHPSGAIS